jgi:hypothetical protein
MDSWLFGPGGFYPLAPSVFVQTECTQSEVESTDRTNQSWNNETQLPKNEIADLTDLFSCPHCGGERTLTLEHEAQLFCQRCSKRYANRDGIWDFKESLD